MDETVFRPDLVALWNQLAVTHHGYIVLTRKLSSRMNTLIMKAPNVSSILSDADRHLEGKTHQLVVMSMAALVYLKLKSNTFYDKVAERLCRFIVTLE